MRDLPLPTLPLSDIRSSRRSLHRSSTAPAPSAARERVRLEVVWARDASDVLEAQRLRYQVFAEEMGARLAPPAGTPAGLDVDVFDPFCEHLLVRAYDHEGEPGQVIGTYRVLTPSAAKRVGGLYSETEFDLTRLRPLRGRMLELGRSCVHPDHRNGGAYFVTFGD